jgi:hypothetical protein
LDKADNGKPTVVSVIVEPTSLKRNNARNFDIATAIKEGINQKVLWDDSKGILV